MFEQANRENYLAALIYEEHIRYIQENKMPECDAMNYSFLMKETGAFAPCYDCHMSVQRIAPIVKHITCDKIIHIVHKERLVLLSILIKLLIQSGYILIRQ